MAIYVDSEIRNPDADMQELCFEYIWHLFYINAVKRKMFAVYNDYDNYALYGATQLYLRYRKEQEEGSKLRPIKSCVNYIKKVLYPYRVEYYNCTFRQVFKEPSDGSVSETLRQRRIEEARKSNEPLMRVEYEAYLNDICKTAKNCLKTSPYRNNKATMHNLYVSCMLSLLNIMTMSRKNQERLEWPRHKEEFTDDLIDKIYEEEYMNSTVVYHLDKSMRNYVSTVVNRLRREVVRDLRYIVGSFEPTDEVLKAVLTATAGAKSVRRGRN